MKTIIAATILSATLPFSLIAEEVKQALIVDAPATWKIEYNGDKGIQFYTAKRKDGDTALLMFSRSPVPGNANQIPEQIEMRAKIFVSQASKSKDFKLNTTEYKVEQIDGATFSGSIVQFSTEGGILHTTFMIGDNEGVWSGQFIGTKERWLEALDILKKLKKKG